MSTDYWRLTQYFERKYDEVSSGSSRFGNVLQIGEFELNGKLKE